MRFEINHTTQYAYGRPVFLEPHFLRLRPRSDMNQCLRRYHLEVLPRPAGISEGLDAENNAFALLWFDGLHPRLEITMTAEVDTLRTNPYEGLLVAGTDHLPLWADLHDAALLRPYVDLAVGQESEGEELSDEEYADQDAIHAFARELLGGAEGRTLDFLTLLASRLHRSIRTVKRPEAGILAPAETLRTGRGACRDLAMVFMAACRQVGIPARFVSGYQQGAGDEPCRELHAWAEVFLPGFGWRGYDPTHGLAVADRHVALAAAALPKDAAAVTGTFRGTGVNATLRHVITIHAE